MIIRMIERDPMDLVRKVRVRWVEHVEKYLGDIVGFATALLDQSGFYSMCYMADHWCPISVVPKQEQIPVTEPPFFETDLEIEERYDPQLTQEDPKTGRMTNIWWGPFARADEIVQYIEGRYKYYIDLAIKKLKDPTFKYPFEE